MDRETALDLIDQIGGDELVWVDYKEDYYVQGNPYEQAEFRKDVQALANADTRRDERYLLIGCADEDGLVGVSDDATDEQAERRHVLSFEADDLQEKLDGSLQPSPQISLHTYEEDGATFGVLVVERVNRVPSVATSTFGDDGNIFLREGDIWIRKSSGKKRADPDDIENIIQRRITLQRDFILEGIRRVVAMDPETIADIGSLQPNEAGEADITFKIDDEGDYTVSGSVFRREFSDLPEELDADIGKRRVNPGYCIDLQSLMRYYSELDVPTDGEAVEVLAESAMSHWIPGIYWLQEISEEERWEVLRNVPDHDAVRHTVWKTVIVAGDNELFESSLRNTESVRFPRLNISDCRELQDKPIDERLQGMYSIATEIDVGGQSFKATEFSDDPDEISEMIPKIAVAWLDSDNKKERQNLKYSLKNLELKLVAEIL